MKKFFLSTLVLAFLALNSFSQSIEEGIKLLGYERNEKAKTVLQQVVNSKPKDAYAIYWLGQAILADKNVAGAKALYQKVLNEGINDPWIWIGMGHVELLETNDINAAKQQFEQAITATKKKTEDPNILNAIGRAMADGSSKIGDPTYGIEKLKKAAELDKKNPDIFVNMGINYLKLGGERGGDAVEAFREAINRNPNNALAMYRIGKIYESQQNKPSMEEWYGKAIAADPAFAPVYLAFFNWYANRDVNVAKEFLDKYMANTDLDCNTKYFEADYLFRAGKYQESLTKTQEMENGACKDFPRIHVLYAYNYNRLGDTVKSKEAIEKFFATAPAGKIQPDDYLFAASVLKRFAGSEEAAISYLQKALEVDTIRKNRVTYMDTIASLYKKQGKLTERLEWLQKSYVTNPNPSNLDIYNIGDAALNAQQFDLADSMFNMYKGKYPEQIFGYLGLSKAAIARDKDTTAGSAVPAVVSFIEFLEKTDKEKYKGLIIQNYGYLVYVHANVLKDYDAAIKDLEGILAVDPANAYALQTKAQIEKVKNRATNQKQPTGGGGTKSKPSTAGGVKATK